MSDLLVARQPIVDAQRRLFGYEILFRGGAAPGEAGWDDDQATSDVLVTAFLDLGLERLVGEGHAFVNLGQDFVEQGHAQVIPPGRVVLEILEHSHPTDRLLEGMARLRAAGHVLALDDYAGQPHFEPLLEQVDWVKVDLMAAAPETWEAIARRLSGKVTLLAEKVETEADFLRCRELGYTYFQGYFFARPEGVQGQRGRSNRLALMRLLATLHDPDVPLERLEALLAQDPALGVRVLRYVNAPAFGLGRQVTSLQQAIGLMGLTALRNWVTLVVLAGLQDKPAALVRLAMVRARTLQLYARGQGGDAEAAFTVGLFSLLDAFFDAPLAQLMEELPLEAPVRRAILAGEGALGRLLEGVKAYERGAWEALADWPGAARLALREAYLEALGWAEESLAALD